LIGRSKRCPSCKADIIIPVPSEDLVRKALMPIPHALPCKSKEYYLDLAGQIERVALLNIDLAVKMHMVTLVTECIDEARRMLLNISTFLGDCEPQADNDRSAYFVESATHLGCIAAGTNFGGIGVANANWRRNAKLARDQGATYLDFQGGPTLSQNEVLARIDLIRSRGIESIV